MFQLFRAKTEAHAVEIANQGHYGLGACCYGPDERAEQVIKEVRSGMAFVNSVTKSDATFPTGGVARSGFGREGGDEGYRQFANIRTVYINHY